MVWEEVETAQKEKRYELVLHGNDISERINEEGLDETIFTLTNLNFLQISQTEITSIPDALGELINLKTLDLHQNKLTELPETLGELSELKFCDISGNCLQNVPEVLGGLTNLHTLNLSCNKITALPSFEKLENLAKFDCSHNQLVNLPEGVYQIKHLAELRAADNQIESILEEVGQSTGLKVLDLSNNKLKVLPFELTVCHKLKELTLIDNPISDNRLGKLIKQCSTKSVLDYVNKTTGKSKGKGKKERKRNSKSGSEDIAENAEHVIQVERSEQYKVIVKPNVAGVRDYIVCVVVKNIDLSQPDVFKKFISMQTRLHENICDHRSKATIATHCMSSITFPLTYEALPISDISLVPLGRHKLLTATEIIADLKTTALKEKLRTKRQPKSGLLKYLSLVESAKTLAFLKSKSGEVISLPPVTNSELSKISLQNMDILIEVTSCDLNTCKAVMDELVKQMFENGMYSVCENNEAQADVEKPKDKKKLALTQVRITDEEGNLKVTYPSKTDLYFESVPVVY